VAATELKSLLLLITLITTMLEWFSADRACNICSMLRLLHCLFLLMSGIGENVASEVLSEFDLTTLRRDEIALLQFDSRPMKDYWLAAAQWNKYYCDLHGHVFLYYTSKRCFYGDQSSPVRLASPWCKVKAMLQANKNYPSVKLFIYMDSDAIIDKRFEFIPVNEMLRTMQKSLNWNPLDRPMVFNQDGPCWWCTLIKNRGYTMCLNAGTVMWYRHPHSEKVLEDWWHASQDSYADNPIRR
jgi:hypothetical protein